MTADHLRDWAALAAIRDRLDAAYQARAALPPDTDSRAWVAATAAIDEVYVELRHWNATGQALPAVESNPQPRTLWPTTRTD